ncbi:hypothetical protein VCV18_008458 [Metarhizium anisopliae]
MAIERGFVRRVVQGDGKQADTLDKDAETASVTNCKTPFLNSSTGSTSSRIDGWRSFAKLEASFFKRSTTSSTVRLKPAAPDRPRELPFDNVLLSKTKTLYALPVDFLVAS